MVARIQDGQQNGGNLLVLFYEKKKCIRKMIFYVRKRVCNLSFAPLEPFNKLKMAAKIQYGHRQQILLGWNPKWTKLCPKGDIIKVKKKKKLAASSYIV